ncbi:MAG: ABC transporter permease [Gammaproteobacteria bacterium]|nr:ABC transporter permease [Gammaproteobacteria bacterium]
MLNLEPRQLAIVAGKEFRDRLRSRWVLVAATVFTVFALVIAFFGTASEGAVGLQGLDATIASLVSLVIYLVPLIALILGYDAVVGESERGSLDLLLSMPITRAEFLLGKFCGLAAALAVATFVGFGLVGAIFAWSLGVGAMAPYLVFMLSTLALGCVFLSLAVALSVAAKSRVTAIGLAVALWFFYVLVYDLLLLGSLVADDGRYSGAVLPFALMLNPTDVYRLTNIAALPDMRSLYGLATVVPDALGRIPLLGSVLVLWIVTPLFAAYRLLEVK